MRRAVRDRSAAQSTSRGRNEATPRRRERSERSSWRRGYSRSAAIAGTVGDGSSAAATAERCRRRPGRRPERSQATFGAGAAPRGPWGPRYVLRPDASGRVARFPRAPGHADPAEEAQRPEPLGEARSAATRGSRRPDAAPRAQPRGSLTAAVEASPAPSRAQRRAGTLHGGRHDVSDSERGRRRARCPPPSARAASGGVIIVKNRRFENHLTIS